MSWLRKIVESIRQSEDLKDLRSSSLRDWVNGEIFTKNVFRKQYRLLLMCAVLAFFYVDNRYSCESLIAKQIKLKKDIQDLKYESLTISAELMQLSRQSSVLEMVRARGLDLEIASIPPVVIQDSTQKK
jgi:Bacteriodetes cell division protein (FtsL-like)